VRERFSDRLFLSLFASDLSSEKLPNMDAMTTNVRDRTDAFACLVFEDCLVMTDVIGDTLSPRWMPWCQRAFVFNITHPSSILQLGLFDFDPELSPLQMISRAASDVSGMDLLMRSIVVCAKTHSYRPFVEQVHDPIGRIQIHLSNFYPDTEYTTAVCAVICHEVASDARVLC